MQCQEIAYSIGKKLRLPVINVDNCIVEALLGEFESASRDIVITAVNETYESTKRNMKADVDEHDEGYHSPVLYINYYYLSI